MNRWRGKIAVITGASAGIGLAIVRTLVQKGMTVVGLARRKNKMLKEMSGIDGPGEFYAIECNVSKKSDIVEAFNFIEKNLKTVHVLINNAGIGKPSTIEDASMEDLEEVINCNITSLLHCSKLAIKLMKENGDEGYIVNIASTLGHQIVQLPIPMNIYPASKFAVRAISETLINELQGNKIRVTNLSPGLVATDMSESVINITNLPALKPEDIANTVEYLLGTPNHVHITELTMQCF